MRRPAAIGVGMLCLTTGGPAIAQPLPHAGRDWSGFYVGTDLGVVRGRGDIEATLDPVRDARFTYLEGPASRTFSTARHLPRQTHWALRAGRLLQTGSIVWGVEGQVGSARLERNFAFGPFDAGAIRTNPEPGIASPTGTTDTLNATLGIEWVASLRGQIGVPLGDRALVSVFAGPSFARSWLNLTQQSSIVAFSCSNPARPTLCFTNDVTVTNAGPGSNDDLWGGIVGGAVDLKISDHWLVHGEAGASRYDGIQARSNGTSGGDSRFAYEPELYWASIGLSYRF